MKTSRQYELTLENGERRIITEEQLKKGTYLYYTEIGQEFGMVAVVDIQTLPNKRILSEQADAHTTD